MRKLRWQVLLVALALVAIIVILQDQEPPSPQTPNIPEPVGGGVYSEGLIGSLGRLNPLFETHNQADRDINRLLYSSLVRFDVLGLPQVDLAESWGISHDGTTYNFSLRQEAVWHDGTPVTSADVLYTIELLRKPEYQMSDDIQALWKEVDAAAVNETTLRFQLPDPFAPFLDYLTFGILPEHLLGGLSLDEMVDASFNLAPVGSGPYRFEQWITEQGRITGLVLNAFDRYYGEAPFIEEIEFYYYPDESSALEAYRQGEILGLGKITPETLRDVLKEPELNLYTARLPELALILVNLDNPEVPFFQDVAIRSAMLRGLNRQRMIDQILNGQATIADGPIFPNTWAFYDGVNRVDYDPEEALWILREAGYSIPAEGGDTRAKDGILLQFSLVYPDDEDHKLLAESIQRDWAQIGIAVLLEPMPFDVLVNETLNTRLYQAALVDLNLSKTPDPDPYPFWHQTQSTGGQNYSLWNDRQASEYLEQARIIVDVNERQRLYRNFQIRFANQLPALPLFYPMYTYAVDSQVQGVGTGPLLDPSDRFATVNNWFLFTESSGGIETAVSQEE